MTTPKPPSEDDAIAVSDFVLQMTENAYLARDFETFALWFDLPHTLGTFEGDRIIATRTDLVAVFEAMCAHFDANGIVALHRTTLEARFLDPDTIQATFASRHVMQNHVFGKEIIAHGLMKRVEDRWKISDSRYATQDTSTARALHTRPDE